MSNPRPFPSESLISPHAALAALGGVDSDHPYAPKGTGGTGSGNGGEAGPSRYCGARAPRDERDERDEDRARTGAMRDGPLASSSRPHQSSSRSPQKYTSPTPGQSARAPSPGAGALASDYDEAPYLVRARFDFTSGDSSALVFRAGDVIEVITMLESGWWDGMIGQSRGWFPSNYIEDLPLQEEEEEEEREREQEREQPGGGGIQDGRHPLPSGPGGGANPRRRSVFAEDVVNMDDVFGEPGWGVDAYAESMGINLDALASNDERGQRGAGEGRGRGLDMEDDFAAAARAAQHRAALQHQSDSRAPVLDQRQEERYAHQEQGRSRARGVVGGIEDELGGADDFGAGLQNSLARRERTREATNETVRASKSAPAPARDGTPQGAVRADEWVPCLTPDGEVYYHNSRTGVDTWELPIDYEAGTPDDGDEYLATPASRTNSLALSDTATNLDSQDGADGADDFRLPPKVAGELPYPWTSRLNDEGTRWFYVNKLTGETSATPPPASKAGHGGARGSAASGTVPPPAPPQGSSQAALEALEGTAPAQISARAVKEWQVRSRRALLGLFPQPQAASMAVMLDGIHDALRDVLEAAVAGSAAEEEISRASDLRSAAILSEAMQREDAAAESLQTAHRGVLAAIRDLLRAFGYVGPIDRMDGMPRPPWTGDMTLIGTMGVFSANVHAATISKRASDSVGQGRESPASAWQDVTRSAYRLRDVVSKFPDAIAKGNPEAKGKTLSAWVGLEGLGELCGGRWGFGGDSTESVMHLLDMSMVQEAKHVQAEFASAVSAARAEARDSLDALDALELLRIAARFRGAFHNVDIASIIDLDGEPSSSASSASARDDDLRAYVDFVEQGRKALKDFDDYACALEDQCADLYLACCSLAPTLVATADVLGKAIADTARALGAVHAITAEQHTLVETTPIVGKIGARSARSTSLSVGGPGGGSRQRPMSMSSQASRTSRLSRASKGSKTSRTSRASALDAMRNRVRGIEDDFQDAEDLASEGAGSSASDLQQRGGDGRGSVGQVHGLPRSTSGSALARGSQGAANGNGRDASAASSSTSLGYGHQQQQQQQLGHGHAHVHGQGQGHGHAHQQSLSQRTESDSGSLRGNRTSFMKTFMRGRSDSDADSGRGSQRTRSKKLAKLLGEDPMLSSPFNPNGVQAQAFPRDGGGQSISPRMPFTNTTSSWDSTPPIIHPDGRLPAYLSEDYDAGDLVVDEEKGTVKAGTLEALVVRLTRHGIADTAFTQQFLLTFRSFVSPAKFLDLLLARYNIAAPQGLSQDQMAEWKRHKQTPIRLRVANCIRQWLDTHFVASEDMDLLPRMEEFAGKQMVADKYESLGMTMVNLIEKRRQGEEPNIRRNVSGGVLSPPAPLAPRVSGKPLQLLDINPVEMARQLSIFDFSYFQRIRLSECLNKAWQCEDPVLAPNVRAAIHTSNRISAYVTLSILQGKDTKTRASIIRFWLAVYAEIKNLNNFSAIASLCAGVGSSPISRLKRTLELLTGKWITLKDELDAFMDSTRNFKMYKEKLKAVNPPCVPFLGFYLTSLTFIEDGNKSFWNPQQSSSLTPSQSMSSLNGASGGGGGGGGQRTPTALTPATSATAVSTPGTITDAHGKGSSGGTHERKDSGVAGQAPVAQAGDKINFFKRSLSADILRDIHQYQSQPYNLAKCRPVWDFILRALEQVEDAGDLYDMSLVVEPREKEEEKIPPPPVPDY